MHAQLSFDTPIFAQWTVCYLLSLWGRKALAIYITKLGINIFAVHGVKLLECFIFNFATYVKQIYFLKSLLILAKLFIETRIFCMEDSHSKFEAKVVPTCSV